MDKSEVWTSHFASRPHLHYCTYAMEHFFQWVTFFVCVGVICAQKRQNPADALLCFLRWLICGGTLRTTSWKRADVMRGTVHVVFVTGDRWLVKLWVKLSSQDHDLELFHKTKKHNPYPKIKTSEKTTTKTTHFYLASTRHERTCKCTTISHEQTW